MMNKNLKEIRSTNKGTLYKMQSCPGHNGSKGCFLYKQEKSFWGLCLSCMRVQNRLFLEAANHSIRDNTTEFLFDGKQYSLNDSEEFLKGIHFIPSSQDPRLTLLMISYINNPQIFKKLVNVLLNDISFLTSANLLYRRHLPSRATCGVLHTIYTSSQMSFPDLPICPACMSRTLCRKKSVNQKEINHILTIFRNRVLSQHPTWSTSIFHLLQTIWEQDLEDKLSLSMVSDILTNQNPVVGRLLETPAIIEKSLKGVISEENREFLKVFTQETVTMPFIKRIQRTKMADWKEDLIIKTWHPSRLMTWCLDIEELKDFEPIE